MKKPGKHTVFLNVTDSTNNYANRLISEGKAVEGTAVLTSFQEQGRGQRGNHWESDPGMNLLASFILFPRFLPAGMQFYLSKIASLALVDWLQQETTGVTIKWPNDIYVGEQKIAGILIETSVQGNQFHSAVVGVGLNLNQKIFNPALPNPVSLKKLTGRHYNIKQTAQQLQEILMAWYRKLAEGQVGEIDAVYHRNLFRKDEWAHFQKGKRLFEARILGTGEFGQLILEERSGNKTTYSFKEIEFVI